MDPQYITIHETDNPKSGADAEAHARLQYNGNSRAASWHYTVDDKEIWQSIPDNEVAWHAGDGGSGTGNRKSIGIEICVNSDGNFEKAKQNAVELVRYLMAKHNIPLSRVVPHKHWSGKNCPRHILPQWSQFTKQIQEGGIKVAWVEDMYDLSYLLDDGSMKNTLSSQNTELLEKELTRLTKAKANCIVISKRSVDVEVKRKDGGFYRVQVGAFKDKENAEGLAERLKKDGYPTYIVHQ
nr:N-acetylmuramoyl-L-alanine amidase [Paenactinomyces guangxiensis]